MTMASEIRRLEAFLAEHYPQESGEPVDIAIRLLTKPKSTAGWSAALTTRSKPTDQVEPRWKDSDRKRK